MSLINRNPVKKIKAQKAAEILGVSAKTAIRWGHEGAYRVFKAGRSRNSPFLMLEKEVREFDQRRMNGEFA
jgi:predicted site-specific integrase-resolvase